MTPPKPKRQAKPKQYSLDDLATAAGDYLLDVPDAEILLGSDAACLVAGEQDSHPDLTRVSDDSLGYMRAGVPLGQLASVVQQLGITYELRATACDVPRFVITSPSAGRGGC